MFDESIHCHASHFSQGNVTFSCAEPVSIAVTFTDSQSFLQLPGLTSWSSGSLSLALQFRTWNQAGLLLTFELPQQKGSVWLYLNDTRLRLQISKADGTHLELSAGQTPSFSSFSFKIIKCFNFGQKTLVKVMCHENTNLWSGKKHVLRLKLRLLLIQ